MKINEMISKTSNTFQLLSQDNVCRPLRLYHMKTVKLKGLGNLEFSDIIDNRLCVLHSGYFFIDCFPFKTVMKTIYLSA